MGKISKYTEKDFKEKIDSIYGKGNYLISNFINTSLPVTVTHTLCGSTYSVIASTIIRETSSKGYKRFGCWTCWKKQQFKSNEWFVNKVKELCGSEYVPLSSYKRAKDKVLMKHNTCGYQWYVAPSNFIGRNSRCPRCNHNARLTTKTFKAKMKNILGDDYTFESEYKNAHTKVLCKHSCGYSWLVSPDSLVQGTRCPRCSSSKGEQLVSEILDSNNIKYVAQKRFNGCYYKKPLPFDFFIPDSKVCIEYDGEQHFFPVNFGGEDSNFLSERFLKGKNRDSIKDDFCKNEGITLLRLPYYLSKEEIENKVLKVVKK